jgi:hypothetical protein
MNELQESVGQLAAAFDSAAVKDKSNVVDTWLRKNVPFFTGNDGRPWEHQSNESEMAKLNEKIDAISTNAQAAAILGLFDK